MRYGIRRRLMLGKRITIFPSFICSLDCPYCSAKMPTGKMPREKTRLNEFEWMDLLETLFNKKRIKEISFSGGEPTMYSGILFLVEWLLWDGKLVKIFSNLAKRIQFPISDRLIISTTYHKSDNYDRWKANLDWYRTQGTRVIPFEIGESEHETITKPWCDIDYLNNVRGMFFGPDGKQFDKLSDLFRYYAEGR